jgi:uncharacterized protein YcgI (DUF1989 family)
MAVQEILVPAQHGRAFEVLAGQRMTVIDVEGKQVGDLCALSADDHEEYMFLPPTRLAISRIPFRIGDALMTNRRRPLFRLVEDDVRTHDIWFGTCDRYRYETEFGLLGHRNCRDNLIEALTPMSIDPTLVRQIVPEAINIFLNQRIDPDFTFHLEEPLSKPGDSATFECLLNAIVAISACPEDMTPCNGFQPTDMLVRIEDA